MPVRRLRADPPAPSVVLRVTRRQEDYLSHQAQIDELRDVNHGPGEHRVSCAQERVHSILRLLPHMRRRHVCAGSHDANAHLVAVVPVEGNKVDSVELPIW